MALVLAKYWASGSWRTCCCLGVLLENCPVQNAPVYHQPPSPQCIARAHPWSPISDPDRQSHAASSHQPPEQPYKGPGPRLRVAPRRCDVDSSTTCGVLQKGVGPG